MSDVSDLLSAASNVAKHEGTRRKDEMVAAADLLFEWLGFLNAQKTGVADEMLDGVRSAIVEATACAVLGLVRPCMFSLRAQIDMLLAWSYLKDHKVEWTRIDASTEDYVLPSVVLKYLNKYWPGFKDRFDVLSGYKKRKCEPYPLLSEHAHSQSFQAIPNIAALSAVVEPGLIDDCVKLQFDVSEYLSDIMVAWQIDRWTSLPEGIVDSLNKRMSEDKISKLFP